MLAAYIKLRPRPVAPVAQVNAVQASTLDHDSLVRQLLEECRSQLPSAAVPAVIQLVPELPRSAAGKLLRSQLPHPATLLPAAATANSRYGLSLSLLTSVTCSGTRLDLVPEHVTCVTAF